MLDENFRNLNLNSAIDFETDSGEYKFWMPGDLQPPNQTPFNENWYRLDKILSERKTNFLAQLETLNGTITDNKSISDNKFNEITNQFNILNQTVVDNKTNLENRLNTIENTYVLTSSFNTAVEGINEDIQKRALKSEIPTDYVTMADVEAKGYLTSDMETDPTVPAWAKEATKPSYNISEIIVDTANNKSLATLITELQSEIGTLKEKISKLEGGAVE